MIFSFNIAIFERLRENCPFKLRATVAPYFASGARLSCAHIRFPDGRVHLQNWLSGKELFHSKVPCFVAEFSLVHELHVALDFAGIGGPERWPDVVEIATCDWKVCKYLRLWRNTGRLGLASVRASDVADLCNCFADVLQCPLQPFGTDAVLKPEDIPGSTGPPDIDAAPDMISIQCGYFLRTVPRAVEEGWGGRLAPLPLSKDELKDRFALVSRQNEVRSVSGKL